MSGTITGQPSDRHLIERIRAGDSTAFEELYRAYSPDVLRTALRYMPSSNSVDAYDVVQQVFVALFQRIDSLSISEEFSFPAYIRVLTRNQCRDYIRRLYAQRARQHVEEVPLSEAKNIPDDASDPIEHIDSGRFIRNVLSSLNEIDRRIVQMRLLDNATSEEVAKALDLSSASVRVRYFRIITRLRQQMEHARAEEFE